ncbi:molybdopterin synthase catalytic subunit MoaE [Alkalimonas mucilaginosa]|uniref:Molybdopterin synthase catalytic subunit n=1 Tax=Alkalimonas mucilaginosa TaxID=3057676 RepID=A0ABU7JJ57_9GAMM|nr:molybdopterin synthase catalytic subunit MoaE [Alkalimonas sp. MEB004]MEE2025717.1 molybdopterin synthase catalytic subunit MoaE [Alkalimonas sp. MEB004]
MSIVVQVQSEDFCVGTQYQLLSQDSRCGAVVTFTGLVRELSSGDLQQMTLEHYPGMTEQALDAIAREAQQRWQLGAVRIIHRIGALTPNEQIVFVGVASAHRAAAFAAAQFVMDYLKTRAPFWKKECTAQGESWVAAKASDQDAAERWG